MLYLVVSRERVNSFYHSAKLVQKGTHLQYDIVLLSKADNYLPS
jgi:hypothetical protein